MNSATNQTIKDSLTTQFLNHCPFDEFNGPIISAFNKSRASELKTLPQNILSVRVIDIDNRNIPLQEILQRYKGNVIYIDFWASWCGPYKEEMPYSATLSKKFKNKPVKFVYFSIDK